MPKREKRQPRKVKDAEEYLGWFEKLHPEAAEARRQAGIIIDDLDSKDKRRG